MNIYAYTRYLQRTFHEARETGKQWKIKSYPQFTADKRWGK